MDGKVTGYFYNLQGGDIEVAVIKHDVVFGTGASSTLFIPGATSYSPLTLSRGFANYITLYNWLMEASSGDIIQARRSGTIEGRKYGVAVARWNLFNAWPTKLVSYGFQTVSGTQSTVARVTLTLVAESIEYEHISL